MTPPNKKRRWSIVGLVAMLPFKIFLGVDELQDLALRALRGEPSLAASVEEPTLTEVPIDPSRPAARDRRRRPDGDGLVVEIGPAGATDDDLEPRAHRRHGRGRHAAFD